MVKDGTLARMPLLGGQQIPPNCEDHRKFKMDWKGFDSQWHSHPSHSREVMRCMAPLWVLQVEGLHMNMNICSLTMDKPHYLSTAHLLAEQRQEKPLPRPKRRRRRPSAPRLVSKRPRAAPPSTSRRHCRAQPAAEGTGPYLCPHLEELHILG